MIHITEEFAIKNNGVRNGVNIFNSVKCDNPKSDNYGKYVCSENSINEFPELFTDTNFNRIKIIETDFVPKVIEKL